MEKPVRIKDLERRKRRPSTSKRGYDSNWRKVRKFILFQEPLCRFCKKNGRVEAATVVDHITPIEKRPDLRLEASNLQPLCKPCHDREKQSQDKRGYSVRVGNDGWPVDSRHPFWKGGK